MIGAGVFTSTGLQAAGMHDPKTILVCWIVGGVIALCGATCYAELGSMLPRAGGEYVYLREAYHPAVGFMSGVASLTAGFSAPIAAAGITFASYLGKIVPQLDGHTKIIAIVLILAVTAMHMFDSKVGGRIQAGLTIGKVILIFGFIVIGLLSGNGHWSNLNSVHGGLSNVGTGSFAISLMYVGYSYLGWNSAAYIANEVEKPERTIPRALLLGTLVVMALYLLLNMVFLYAVPVDTLAGNVDGAKGPIMEVGDTAARVLFGHRAGAIVSSVIALALVSSVSAMIMAGPRVYAAMATDRALPSILAHHNKNGVPMNAVVIQGVLAIAFVLVGDLAWLLQFVGFTLAIFAALAVSAVFILRGRGLTSRYKTWGYPITPAIFIAMSAWVTYNGVKANPRNAAIGAAALGAAAIVYYFFMRNREPLPDESLPEGMSTGPVLKIPIAEIERD
jgi:APA family basic amino acid/polyamine antiporter